MTTPTRSELMVALREYDAAERAWRDFLMSAMTGEHYQPGTAVTLDEQCRTTWDALQQIAVRLPDEEDEETGHEVG